MAVASMNSAISAMIGNDIERVRKRDRHGSSDCAQYWHHVGSSTHADRLAFGQNCRVPMLFLLRHAKSSWDDASLPDLERPLAPRGERAARRIAGWFGSECIAPELVVCSSARRARDTFALIQPVFPVSTELRVTESLYGADASAILGVLRAVGSEIASVMLVGHNPGLEDLAIGLAGDGDPGAMAQLRAKFPTAALACLDATQCWALLDWGDAHLTKLVVPRELQA